MGTGRRGSGRGSLTQPGSEARSSTMACLAPADLGQRELEVAEHDSGAHEGRNTHTPLGSFAQLLGGNLVFSASHEAEHRRNGEHKRAEPGTAKLAAMLAARSSGSALWTYGTQKGDPNWDLRHPYADRLVETAKGGGVIDLHVMRDRGVMVCLGLGPSHQMSKPLWEPLLEQLLDADVRVAINWPFGSRGRTLTARTQKQGIMSIQVEMIPEVFCDGHPARTCVVSALLRTASHWSQTIGGKGAPEEQDSA